MPVLEQNQVPRPRVSADLLFAMSRAVLTGSEDPHCVRTPRQIASETAMLFVIG